MPGLIKFLRTDLDTGFDVSRLSSALEADIAIAAEKHDEPLTQIEGSLFYIDPDRSKQRCYHVALFLLASPRERLSDEPFQLLPA